jgi:hypothetical protein
LSYGAQSVDWWDVHNYGTPTADFGMFSSATSGEPAVNSTLVTRIVGGAALFDARGGMSVPLLHDHFTNE